MNQDQIDAKIKKLEDQIDIAFRLLAIVTALFVLNQII